MMKTVDEKIYLPEIGKTVIGSWNGKLSLHNIKKNIIRIPDINYETSLPTIDQGKTCILTGSGKSFYNNSHKIQRMELDVISVNGTIDLVSNTIPERLKYIVISDPQQIILDYFLEVPLDKLQHVLFLSSVFTHPDVIKHWTHKQHWFSFKGYNSFLKDVVPRSLGKTITYVPFPLDTVVNYAVYLLYLMGYKNVILAGIDFCENLDTPNKNLDIQLGNYKTNIVYLIYKYKFNKIYDYIRQKDKTFTCYRISNYGLLDNLQVY